RGAGRVRAGRHRERTRHARPAGRNRLTALASAALDEAAWAASHDRLIASLRDLIRIRSINPPDPPGGELEAARYLAGALEDGGIPAVVHEPVPGRGSVAGRPQGHR